MEPRKETTLAQVEEVEKYLTYARFNGASLDCISKSYLGMLDTVLRHVRVRLARGEWPSSDQPTA